MLSFTSMTLWHRHRHGLRAYVADNLPDSTGERIPPYAGIPLDGIEDRLKQGHRCRVAPAAVHEARPHHPVAPPHGNRRSSSR